MKRSVFLKIGLLFVGTYFVYTLGYVFYSFAKDQDEIRERRFRMASNYLSMGRALLQQENVEDLSFRLDDAVNAYDIAYYLIRKNGQDIVFSNLAGADEPLRFPDGEEGVYDREIGQFSYRSHVIRQGDYYLAVGYKTSFIPEAEAFLKKNFSAIYKDFLFLSLLVLALTAFSFRDLLSVLASLKKRGASRADIKVARSKETLTLIQGLKGYEDNAESLSRENSVLKGQVLPALQNELRSGKAPPYEFNCTMVRTDINNFTSIFSSQDRAQFMEIINEFFVGVAHITSRYTGFVYEFIGDEVLFYFKDEDHENSPAIALTAVRDIHALADSFNDRTERDYGYSFRVKTSLSYGTLRFGPLVNGFSLAGNPLIETVRMLSHIHEKSFNTALFDAAVHSQVSGLCASQEFGVVMLKGLANQRRLYNYQSHVPVGHHLKQDKHESFKLAALYRSDDDIREILNFVNEKFETLSQKSVVQILSVFKGYTVTSASPEIKQAYLSLLEKLTGFHQSDDKAVYSLASLISATAHLFPPAAFQGRVREAVLNCLNLENKRIVANALDTFAALDPSAGEAIFNRYIDHADNRIIANALVKQAKLDWNKKTSKALKNLLQGKSAYHKASGLWALGEICVHLKKADEVSFSSDLALQALVNEAVALASHPNQMVRRQSHACALKAKAVDKLLGQKLSLEARNEINALLASHAETEIGSGLSKVS